MLEQFLTPSTKTPVGSSGGVSQINSMGHWNQVQPINFPHASGITNAPTNYLKWNSIVPGGSIMHMIAYPQLGNYDRGWSQWLQVRVICYALLDAMPDEALQETLTALLDHLEYYSMPYEATPALPPVQEVQGTIAEVMERPPLYIDEE